MQELIQVSMTKKGSLVVSGRDLHQFLEIGRDFTTWCKQVIDTYGFLESVDYVKKVEADQYVTRHDYILKLDIAKEIAMVQRSDKGRQVRQYFIECERLFREGKMFMKMPTHAEALRGWANAIEETERQAKQLEEQRPKVEYHDNVLQSTNLITTTVIAKELGMSAIALNRKLHELGIIYKCQDTWVLYAKYQDKGYAGTKTALYTGRDGGNRTSIDTQWTEAGREFIHNLVNKHQ